MNMLVSPAISVIMSIYNEPEEWLRESIESILNQTFTDFEFIIINDNPERQLNDVLLNEYKNKDKRIIVIKNEKNIGLTRSLNSGINASNGEYIARMDADDISLPERLMEQIIFMKKNHNVIVCGSNIIILNNNHNRLKTYPEYSNFCKDFLFFNSCFAHPSVMLRRRVLVDNSIFYNINYLKSQDYGLWCDLIDYGDFYNIQKPLLKYRLSENQISSNTHLQQASCAKLIRRYYFLKRISIPKIIDAINSNNISLKTINSLPRRSSKWILFSLYMSLSSYSILTLLNLIFTLSFFRLPFKYNILIIKKIIDKFNGKKQESYL